MRSIPGDVVLRNTTMRLRYCRSEQQTSTPKEPSLAAKCKSWSKFPSLPSHSMAVLTVRATSSALVLALDSTLGIHPTRLVDFSPLHQQNLTRLSPARPESGLLRLVHDPKSGFLRQLILDSLLVVVLIPVLILAFLGALLSWKLSS